MWRIVFLFCFFYFGTLLKRNFIIDLSILLFFINFLGTFVSAIVQLREKKWYYTIIQTLTSIYLFLNVSLIIAISLPDYYGAHKIIPKGIEIDEPLNKKPINKDLRINDFVIVNFGQPGGYTYYTNVQLQQLGKLYLKVYELTSNDRLSESSILEKSSVNVKAIDSCFYSSSFTIYEGDWGDKYGARIELWLKPKIGKESKVLERNYIVEGWMR